MEMTGPITLVYIMFALPRELGIRELPWGNWIMAGCFVCIPILLFVVGVVVVVLCLSPAYCTPTLPYPHPHPTNYIPRGYLHYKVV
jgi:hypothetical protein